MNAPLLNDRNPFASNGVLLAMQSCEIGAFFDRYIPTDRPVALLAYGWDANVGNHMMWLAIRAYLKRRGVKIAYACHTDNLRVEDLIRSVGDGTILFLGGVSVSRLWPVH